MTWRSAARCRPLRIIRAPLGGPRRRRRSSPRRAAGLPQPQPRRHGHAELAEEHVIPDEHLIAVDLGGDTHPRERAERGGLSQRQPRSSAPCTIATAMWCSESRSALAASQHSLLAPAVAKSDGVGQCRPAVGEVPVLSKAIAASPRCPPGGASFEENAVAGSVGQPERVEAGVEITSAQGEATTSRVMAR